MCYNLGVGKGLAGAVRFGRTDPVTAGSLDYKSSALNPSAMLPIEVVRAGGLEPPRGCHPGGFKDHCVSRFRHTRIKNGDGKGHKSDSFSSPLPFLRDCFRYQRLSRSSKIGFFSNVRRAELHAIYGVGKNSIRTRITGQLRTLPSSLFSPACGRVRA